MNVTNSSVPRSFNNERSSIARPRSGAPDPVSESREAGRTGQPDGGWAWPIVARADEFRRALTALDDGEFQGVALVGDSGTGKSTLARMLAKSAESAGRTVRFALGTQTGCSVPLGAFSHAVTLEAVHEPAMMLAAAHKTLGRDKNLLVVVDDAQLLDPLSATLVNQLAASRSARLVVTVRSGEPVVDAVTALMKERLVLTVHIDPFTREQTSALARVVLGDSVEQRLIDELYERSAGNLLLLRGLLSASRQNGALAHTNDGWQIRGPLRADRELYDFLELRLRSLTADELEVVEILATAEVLDWEILRGMCDTDAVASLERRAMIQLVADDSHTLAQLNHPILGEAALRHAGTVRSRQLNGILAQAIRKQFQAAGRSSRLPDLRGRLRLAQFMVRSDLTPDLDVVVEAAADALAMSNVALGEELARFAYDRGGGLPAAMVLAEAVSWQGHGDEAETLLVEAGAGSNDEKQLAQWGCLRAANLFWRCGDIEAARQILVDMKKRLTSEADTHLVNALEVSMAFFCGDVATTLESGPALCASELSPIATVCAAVPTCAAVAVTGPFVQVHQIADTALQAAALCGRGMQRFNIGMAEIMVATAAGDFSAAERLYKRYAAMAAGVPEANAMVHAMLGMVQFARGDLPSACTEFNDSEPTLSQGFPSPWFVLVAAQHAQAEAGRGDGEAAAAAARRAEKAYGAHVAVFLPELELAWAWERASVGDMTAAQVHTLRAAHVAENAGMHAVEMRALHTAVRFGDPSRAKRLEELAESLSTPLSEAVASHARGLADHDAGRLDLAAARFAGLGAVTLAADASAQAAGEHARRGDRGKRFESSSRASSLARRWGVHTPAVRATRSPLPLSGREREIATLVVAGMSNREIADRLVVSVRTVEGHLYRLFTKLGVNNRDQLIHLWNSMRGDEGGGQDAAVERRQRA